MQMRVTQEDSSIDQSHRKYLCSTVALRHEGGMSVICNYDSKHFFNEPEQQ